MRQSVFGDFLPLNLGSDFLMIPSPTVLKRSGFTYILAPAWRISICAQIPIRLPRSHRPSYEIGML